MKSLDVQVTKEGQLSLSKVELETFLADLDYPSVIQISVKKPRKPSRKAVSKSFMDTKELQTKAVQLCKAYSKEKKAHFHHPGAVKEINIRDRTFQHFKKAVPIIERHKVTYKKFIRAQIFGLKWTNNGKGQFPTPAMLSTESAETRLMEYMKETVRDGKLVQVNITKEERNLPLTKNHTYMASAKKVKDGIATLDETLYVQELQLIRKGQVRDWVKSHLEKLEMD